MTVLDLIKSSLRLIQQLGPGRSPGASETADALLVLNSMLEAWANERLLVYHIPRELHTLTPSKQSYELGWGGDFDQDPTVRIERAGIIVGDTEDPVEVLRDADQWAAITDKALSGQPSALYHERTVPMQSVYLWPVPEVAYQIALYAWKTLGPAISGTLTDLADIELSFPPGYPDAIRYNLAVRLAPEWNRPLRQDVVDQARETKAAIKRMNTPALEMSCDSAVLLPRPFDWMTGQ